MTASGCTGGRINWSLLGGSGQANGNLYTISQPGSCSLNACQSADSPALPLRIDASGALQLLAPTYDCQTGAITFNTTGGDGALIEYFAIGITPWSPNPHQTLEAELRADPKKVVLLDRQSGLTVSYRFDLPAGTFTGPEPGLELFSHELVLL